MKTTNKIKILSKFAKELFESDYKDNMNNESYDEFKRYDSEIIKKAKELNFDLDNFEIDGECLGFPTQEEYNNSIKTFYIEYFEQSIFFYEWKD